MSYTDSELRTMLTRAYRNEVQCKLSDVDDAARAVITALIKDRRTASVYGDLYIWKKVLQTVCDQIETNLKSGKLIHRSGKS